MPVYKTVELVWLSCVQAVISISDLAAVFLILYIIYHTAGYKVRDFYICLIELPVPENIMPSRWNCLHGYVKSYLFPVGRRHLDSILTPDIGLSSH